MQESAVIGGSDTVGSRRGSPAKAAPENVSVVVARCDACGRKVGGTMVSSGVLTYCSHQCARIEHAQIPGNYLG
jgi:hypothetical protein